MSEKNLIEKYSECWWAQGIVGAIPWLGSLIDAFLTGKARKITERRLKCFLEELSNSLHDLQDSAANRQYIQSEEFLDLLVAAFEASLRTRSREKTKLYADILKGAITDRGRAYSAEEYLQALSSLTVKEIQTLRLMYESEREVADARNELVRANAAAKSWRKRAVEEMGLSSGDLDLMLRRLQAAGFVKEVVGAYFDYTGGAFITTEALGRLMEFLGIQ